MQITDKHRAAIRRIIEGRPDSEIRKLCDIKQPTLAKWKHDPEFKSALEAHRQRVHDRWVEIQGGAKDREDFGLVRQLLAETRDERMQGLVEIMRTGPERERRQAILDLNRMDGLGPRDQSLEVVLSGTDEKIDLLRTSIDEAMQASKLLIIKERHAKLQSDPPS